MKYPETLSAYSFQQEYSLSFPLTLDILNDLNSKKLGSDILTLTMSFHQTDSIFEWSSTSSKPLDDFLDKFSTEIVEDDDIAELKVSYSKKNKSEFNIYSPSCLYKYLEGLSFFHFYNAINEKITTSNLIKINSYENLFFNTTLFYTTSTSPSHKNITQRQSILENWSFFTNIQGIQNPKLLPTDFTCDNSYATTPFMNKIITFFNEFSKILSFMFLSDVVKVDNNSLIFKINSHNRLNLKINFKETELINFENLLPIYKWVYTDQGTFLADDKIVFTKDQLSRKTFLNSNNQIEVKHSTFPSILSMHRIYLKENANQYIETTNVVSELISKLNIQQKEIQNSIINALKTSSSIFLSLFISLLVFNSLSTTPNQVFNENNFYLTLLFALLSLITLLVTRHQLNMDLKAAIENFDNTERIYTNIFSENDLKTLFDPSYTKEFRSNIEHSRDLYSWIWLIEVVLVVIVVSILTFIK